MKNIKNMSDKELLSTNKEALKDMRELTGWNKKTTMTNYKKYAALSNLYWNTKKEIEIRKL